MLFRSVSQSRYCSSNNKGRNIKKWHIDHYDTNDGPIVRGLLCELCNPGIGYFKHNYEILEKAKIYLKEKYYVKI